MQKKRMSVREFNHHYKRARFDNNSVKAIYVFCIDIIKQHVYNRFRLNNFYSNMPHDVFTRVAIEYPTDDYISNPVSYLCRAARNYICTQYNLKDNNTLELFENCAYIPDYETRLEFSDEKVEKAWYKLDELSRYILYLNGCLEYRLKEIAEILGLREDYIRTKKCRAKKEFEKSIKQKNKEVNV